MYFCVDVCIHGYTHPQTENSNAGQSFVLLVTLPKGYFMKPLECLAEFKASTEKLSIC